MNRTQDPHAPGFLAALSAVMRHEDFSLKVHGEDDGRMRVDVQVLGHKPLEAVGTPAALDAKLPAAIAEYARWLDRQVATDMDDVEITSPAAAASPSTPAPRKAAPKRARAKAAPRSPKRVRAAAPKRAPARAGRAGQHHHSREECIADWKRVAEKLKTRTFTRRAFLKHGSTGRSYERHWANRWPDFVAAAGGEGTPAAPTAPAKRARPAKPAASAPPKAGTKATGKPAGGPKPWRVLTKAGKELGVTVFDKKIGDGYSCSAGTFVVVAVDAEKREVRVEPARAEAPPPASPEKPAEDAAASRRARGVYAITTTDGKRVGGTVEKHEVGQKWGSSDRYEIAAVDDDKHEYVARDLHAPPAEAAQPAAPTPEETQQ